MPHNTAALIQTRYKVIRPYFNSYVEAVLPYFCFYTGLSLFQTTNALFCDNFGNGYTSRKEMLSQIIDIEDKHEFHDKCVSSYS